jgi:heme-degrading monooxygenase HmoA
MDNVVLINPFEVPKGKESQALEFWKRVARFMQKQPGFVSTRLHQSVVPWAKFHLINIAEWKSAADFEKAVNSEEFKELTKPYMEVFPHFPGLYRLVER